MRRAGHGFRRLPSLAISWYPTCSSLRRTRTEIRAGGFDAAGGVITGVSEEAGGTGVIVAVGGAGAGAVASAWGDCAGAGVGGGMNNLSTGTDSGTGTWINPAPPLAQPGTG